ncbi:2,3-bisphosphoglycerate-independent phosphoglycerate mutase [Wohlfahrtiimonas chitiniclastica]|uniref:2,3-bisphosphoglycerate-independent phosphoglycerate mutase n=1 Tax=Wohlfahrtiimonas chitiniclastica TaxID=400946 RepID=UPI0007B40A9B|nr:2,3-bisphosphoglycerate-independent phosphoglycerate mutase [Wohlfahrtiimonas chitiniclastica]KZS22471.1 phosphoglycerate mutase (2,3-diphosphoglycerate-independent) [Wohlfahrtiimonas chitiniclastica]WHR54959.1 2,3-bisphosphoglycerate-independent phosphoglycerate mutase [Wohlfahrtiimonas chitiniclastica]
MTKAPRPVVLCILDGWGYRTDMKNNAIMAAETPNWEEFKTEGACTLLKTSGMAVGLPEGQMGNSEVGHINIGAGRVVYQDLTRITKAFESGEFQSNPVIEKTLADLKASGKALHIFGLLSDGGVHADEAHIHGLIKVAADAGIQEIYLHAFLDGRDTAPRSAQTYIERAEDAFKACGAGRFASIIGRYYAMDRDNRWERVEQAYDLVSQGLAEFKAPTALAGLEAAYARDENDEFVKATVIGDAVKMMDGDAVIFMNFRSDRARELSYPFTEDDFTGFVPKYRPKLSHYVCLTHYKDGLHGEVAFPPQNIVNGLGEVVAKAGLSQLRIAETEKYPHVTFFFNGGRETVFENEERILVNSPKVATYDLQPEMSAPEVADKLCAAIRSGKFDVIICNFANPDMVGHTGVFDAIVTAIETVDECMGHVYDAVQEVGGELLITADHGNAELTWDENTNQPHTSHTTGPVPLIYLGREATLSPDGALKDLAPTILHLMGLEQPKEMTGHNLVHFK